MAGRLSRWGARGDPGGTLAGWRAGRATSVTQQASVGRGTGGGTEQQPLSVDTWLIHREPGSG